MVAREEGLVLPERAEGLPEPGHASGLRCWRRHGLEASRQQGEQPWPASHAQKLAAERAAADLRKVFVSNHWTWQAAHGARFVVCNACAVRFRQAVSAVSGSVMSKPYDCHAGCWATIVPSALRRLCS